MPSARPSSSTASRSTSPRTILAVAACLTLLVGVGCSHKKKEAAKPHKATTTTTTATVPRVTAPDPTIPKGASLAPLTGLPLKRPLLAFRAALAVKIDNLDVARESARPQAGIVDADVVFEEIVEGNITRLIAVFQSTVPTRVGPVRSARTTDPILLSQLDKPLFAWSGANPYTVGAVHGSSLQDVGHDAVPPAYARDGGRRAPHNLFANTSLLYKARPGAKAPRPMFSYRSTGEKLAAGAKLTPGVRITFGGGAASPTVTYQYDRKADGWRRGQNGTTHEDESHRVVVPRNVVILFTPYATSPADPKSPEAQSVGSGTAWVLSKGRLIVGTWQRDNAFSHWVLKDPKGKVIELTPGKTWIELPRPGGATQL